VIDTMLGDSHRVVRKIGAGGMAEVYEVEHVRLGSRFAAKVARTLSPDEAMRRRFFREARMLASLKSDHVVVVFDVSGPHVDPPFMLMELLNGQDLRQLLRDTPRLSVARASKLVRDACLGLVAVHAAGAIHRDLKPENLFVTHRDTGEECCKLLDFGVVKAEQATSTQHGGLIGTLRYMAPEQIEHAGLVTAQSDVRSLAAILYECLAGRPPFEAPTVEQLLFRVLNECPEPLRTLRPDVPDALEAIVMRALARDQSLRFASARAFADALRPFATEQALDADVTQHDAAVRHGEIRSGARDPRWRKILAVAAPMFVGALAVTMGIRGHEHSALHSSPTLQRPASSLPTDVRAVSPFPPKSGGMGSSVDPPATSAAATSLSTHVAAPLRTAPARLAQKTPRAAPEELRARGPAKSDTGATPAIRSVLRLDTTSPYDH
jgi:serine/threonine protein kinase